MMVILFDPCTRSRRWVLEALRVSMLSGLKEDLVRFVKNLMVLNGISDLRSFVAVADTQSLFIKVYSFNGKTYEFNENRELLMAEFPGGSQDPESFEKDLRTALEKKNAQLESSDGRNLRMLFSAYFDGRDAAGGDYFL